MIDLALYRCRIGLYTRGRAREGFNCGNSKNINYDDSVFSPTNCPRPTKFYRFDPVSREMEENIVHGNRDFIPTNFFMLLYFYIILMFTAISLSFVCSPNFNISFDLHSGVVYLKWDLSFITISQIKIAFFT